ncbi:MAG: D-galactarate dehydratase/Altronate hydrolase-like protein, partial [uncultured Rubrobacteraceae bacterium]
ELQQGSVRLREGRQAARAGRQRRHSDPPPGGGNPRLLRGRRVRGAAHRPRGPPLRRRAYPRGRSPPLLGPAVRARAREHLPRGLRLQREDPARPARALRRPRRTKRRRRPRRDLGPGRGTHPGWLPEGQPGPPRRAQFPRRRARTLRSGRGGFSSGRAGTAPRYAPHLYGLQARRGARRRDAQLRGRARRKLAPDGLRAGAGVGDERRLGRLRERGRHRLRRPHRGR